MNSSYLDCPRCEQGSTEPCNHQCDQGWIAEALEALRAEIAKLESAWSWEDIKSFKEAA